MKEGLKSVTYATGIALSGLLHPASADNVAAQADQNDKTCTIFDDTILRQGEVSNDYQCVGSVKTHKGHVVDIFKVHKSIGERGLYFIERDSKGQEWRRNFMHLDPPNYLLPPIIAIEDSSGMRFTVPLTNGWYTLPPSPTPVPSETPVPTPSRVPTVKPTARKEFYQPALKPSPYPTNQPRIETQDFHAVMQPTLEPVLSTPQPPVIEIQPESDVQYCIDSWGKEVQLGIDRPGTDDCISISRDVPSKGDVTYTYQSEPDQQGNKSLIEVVVTSEGRRYWNWQERDMNVIPVDSPSEAPDTIVKKIQDAFAKLGSFFKLENSEPVVKPQPNQKESSQSTRAESNQNTLQSQEYDYPTFEELPKGIVTEETYSWYNTVVPIAKDLGYDPRTHLVFIHIESKGINGLTSEAKAKGLVQIMPDTWEVIRNTIIQNEQLLALATKNGIDPYTMNVWDTTANIFASGVYLMTYCRLPGGPIPSGGELDTYIEDVAMAGIYYHDGPSSKKNYIEAAATAGVYYTETYQPTLEEWTSPKGREYRQLIHQLLPQF